MFAWALLNQERNIQHNSFTPTSSFLFSHSPHTQIDPLVLTLSSSLSLLPLSLLQFGRTEVIDNTLNPDFVRKFVLDFFFEEKQNLRFDV